MLRLQSQPFIKSVACGLHLVGSALAVSIAARHMYNPALTFIFIELAGRAIKSNMLLPAVTPQDHSCNVISHDKGVLYLVVNICQRAVQLGSLTQSYHLSQQLSSAGKAHTKAGPQLFH
jgi:hypothetical protein